jgi:hypothetical protein
MSTYCTRANVEATYGTTNVSQWADLDDTEVANDITARITRAIAVASEQIDDAARCWHYQIPLADASGSTPTSIEDLAATLAGLWLYEARGSQDFDPNTGMPHHRLAWKRKEAMRALRDIRTGQRKIDAL